MYTNFLDKAKAILAAHKAEYRGVYYMFGGGSSPSGNTTTTQTNQPWSGQEAFLSGSANPNLSGSSSPTGVFQSAAQLYNNPSDYPQSYPGATTGSETSPFTALQNQSLNQAGNLGLNSPLMNSDANMQQFILNGGMLSQGNPYQQAELNALNAQITPQIESQFTQGNAMNNPAAAYATAAGMGSADANLLAQNYNTGQQQITQESMFAPMTYQGQLSGVSTAENAGQTQQTQNQDVLNGMINAYQYNQQLPYQMLNQYAGYVNGNYGGTSTSTQPYYNNTAQNLFSDGTQLGSLALMAYMASDIRLKKNIKHIGKLASGIPIYIFEYLWDSQKHIGCMAHEVEKVIPKAVANIMGFKHVNYAMVR